MVSLGKHIAFMVSPKGLNVDRSVPAYLQLVLEGVFWECFFLDKNAEVAMNEYDKTKTTDNQTITTGEIANDVLNLLRPSNIAEMNEMVPKGS